MALYVKQLEIGGYDSNFSYFIVDDISMEIAIVDPDNVSFLIGEIEQGDFKPVFILITHTHFDHIRGVDELAVKYSLPVYVHADKEEKLYFQKEIRRVRSGEVIRLAGNEIEVLHTPGHAKEAVCYYISREFTNDKIPKLISGDTLFVGRCGRADLEGSNVEDLYNSLSRLGSLPGETEIFPGHDYGETPISTIGWEKLHNKYLLCKNLEEFKKLRLG